jgi:hypothetical protein
LMSEQELARISKIDGIFDMVLTEQVFRHQNHVCSRTTAAIRSADGTGDDGNFQEEVSKGLDRFPGFMGCEEFKTLQTSRDDLSIERSTRRGRSLAAEENCYD